jgi:hypothetical protein
LAGAGDGSAAGRPAGGFAGLPDVGGPDVDVVVVAIVAVACLVLPPDEQLAARTVTTINTAAKQR